MNAATMPKTCNTSRSMLVLLFTASVFLVVSAEPLAAQAQQAPSYWYNKGENGAIDDIVEGEFEKDLGGHIPMDAYANPLHALHYPNLETDMRTSIHDLQDLRNKILAGIGVDILARIDENPSDLGVSLDSQSVFTAWWGQSIKLWNYRINGGYVQILWDENAANHIQQEVIVNILIRTFTTHQKDLSGPEFLPSFFASSPSP